MNFAIFIARRFMLGGKGAGPSRLNGWIAIIGLARLAGMLCPDWPAWPWRASTAVSS